MNIDLNSQKALESKEAIRLAISGKGNNILTENSKLSEYAGAISGINVHQMDITYGNDSGETSLFSIDNGMISPIATTNNEYTYNDYFYNNIYRIMPNNTFCLDTNSSPWNIREATNHGRKDPLHFRNIFIPKQININGTAYSFTMEAGAYIFGQNIGILCFERGITDLRNPDSIYFSMFSSVYDDSYNAVLGTECNCSIIYIPSSVQYIDSSLFSGGNVSSIYVNNSALNGELSNDAPWGANTANVYWLQ